MFPKNFQRLIKHFSALPSIGPKMAERLVMYLYKQEENIIKGFATDLNNFAKEISFCQRCFHLAEGDDLCSICQDKKRDQKSICLVEDPLDVISIEKSRSYSGLYHVLGGNLSIMSKEEIEKLKINELIERVKLEKTEEVIIATNPTTDGETTALYLARVLKPLRVRVSRLGRGMPTGGDIEYADEITLSGAIDGRREI